MSAIHFRGGYKYQLSNSYEVVIDIKPPDDIRCYYIELERNGLLRIRQGYAWDGPSGPTIDTLNFMRGSLVHDALYQLMREKFLDHDTYRDAADRVLQQICLEDGMSVMRAWYIYHAVRLFGNPAADPRAEKPVTFAPNSEAAKSTVQTN